METPTRLVLFDIDGTLVTTEGRAAAALRKAMEQVLGVPISSEGYSFSGKTDPRIVLELSENAGLPRSLVRHRLDEVFSRYLEILEDHMPPGSAVALPGTRSLLDRLADHGGVTLALLTGNVREGAALKLRSAGFPELFPFGAFGSDHEDRNRLVPVAWERALAATGKQFGPEETVVVGDAEADILCARAVGARVVAVATGWTPRERLAALSPDALLDSLATPEALGTILDAGSPA